NRDDDAPLVAAQDGCNCRVDIGMKFEQHLWAGVDMSIVLQAKMRAIALWTLAPRPVQTHIEPRQSHQPFGVMRFGFVRFAVLTRDEIVDRRQSAGDGMPPRHRLHWRQPRMSDAIGERSHANVGIMQY